jgi:D-galactarolactone cycloisomerase
MAAPNQSFTIANVAVFHVVPGGGGYWESYLGGGAAPRRFLVREGWRTAYASAVESVFIRVTLADGSTGWGEPNAPIGPEITGRVARDLLQPLLLGREFEDPTALWDFLYDTERGRGHGSGFYLDAIAGIDLAVWDALARRASLPLATLLSERPRAVLPAYLSGLRQATREERIEAAHRWAGDGLAGIKLFLDGDLAAGEAELQALQDAVPEIGRWMVDVLWSFETLEPAAEAKAAFGARGAAWLECPLLPEDLSGHARLARRPGAPVALGESFHTRFEAGPWLDAGAIEVFQPDIGRTGISDGLRQLAMARAAGVPVTPHMGSGLDLFQAATLSFAAACDDAHLQEYQAGLAGRLGDAVDSAWSYQGGAFMLPDRPGVGVEIDLDRLAPAIVGTER